MTRRGHVPILAIAALVLLIAAIGMTVRHGGILAFDRGAIVGLHDLLDFGGRAWMAETARNVTSLGSVVVVLLIAGAFIGYLLTNGDRASAALAAIAIAGAQVSNNLLKLAFDRPRPDLALPSVEVFTSSFPSGHAALSAAAYFTMASLLIRRSQSRVTSIYVLSSAIFLVFLIGISRIYLGVHYPTDVLAGWCLGGAWALLCTEAGTRMQRRPTQNRRGHP